MAHHDNRTGENQTSLLSALHTHCGLTNTLAYTCYRFKSFFWWSRSWQQMKTCQGKSVDTPNQIIRADEQHKKIYWVLHLLFVGRTSGPSVAGLETTYSGGNGFSTSYNSQRWLNLYLSACKLLDLALALPPESLPQFQMSVIDSDSRLIKNHFLRSFEAFILFYFFILGVF